MDPTVWGPHLWMVMHTLSFNYPVNPTTKDRDSYYTFFKSLVEVIPCSSCREHYKTFFYNEPINNSLNTRDSLVLWVLKCHNNVNKLNNKSEWTKEELFDYYKKIFDKEIKYQYDVNSIEQIKNYIIILLICMLIISVCYRK
jgi:hypothetical protein